MYIFGYFNNEKVCIVIMRKWVNYVRFLDLKDICIQKENLLLILFNIVFVFNEFRFGGEGVRRLLYQNNFYNFYRQNKGYIFNLNIVNV